jgi:hypothetical protein
MPLPRPRLFERKCQVFSQSLRQVIDFFHCGVEYHASFTKQSLSSTLEKSLALTTTEDAFGVC